MCFNNFSFHYILLKPIFQDDSYKYYFGTVQPDKFSPTIQVVAENGRVVIESQVGHIFFNRLRNKLSSFFVLHLLKLSCGSRMRSTELTDTPFRKIGSES